MVHSYGEFRADAARIINRFNDWGRMRRNVDASADHLCYKCGSAAEFERLRAAFEPQSVFIHQSMISERRIALVQFASAWHTSHGEVRLLELSDQKPDGSQRSGFDHLELYPNTGDMASLSRRLEGGGLRFTKVERPHHTTYDAVIFDDFKVRLESEPLLRKIVRDELSSAFT